MQSYITADESIINKASRFFDANLNTVFGELVQNARRAGATQVKIESVVSGDKYKIIIRDDGPGIFQNGFDVKLSGSSWGEQIDSEDPAGMGLFSLCTYNPTIEANGLSVTLDKDQFDGKAPAQVLEQETVKGTKISFHLEVTMHQLSNLLDEARTYLKYYPIPVILNGTNCSQHPFLIGNQKTYEYNGNDVKFQIVKAPYSGSHNQKSIRINFKGHNFSVLPEKLLGQVLDAFNLEILVDINKATNIQFKLPDRQSVVETESWKSFCKHLIQTVCDENPDHNLSHYLYSKLFDAGFRIDEATPLYEIYDLSPDEVTFEQLDSSNLLFRKVTELDDSKVVFADLMQDLSTGQVALFECFGDLDFVAPNRNDKGYSWYNQLEKRKSIRDFCIEINESTVHVVKDEKFVDMGTLDNVILSDGPFTLVLTLKDGTVYKAPCSFIALSREDFSQKFRLEEDNFLLIDSSRKTSSIVESLKYHTYYMDYNEDLGIEEQEHEYRMYTVRFLRDYLNFDDDWMADEIMILTSSIRYFSTGKGVTISIEPDGCTEVKVLGDGRLKPSKSSKGSLLGIESKLLKDRLRMLILTSNPYLVLVCILELLVLIGLSLTNHG